MGLSGLVVPEEYGRAARSFSGSISTGGLNTYIKDANEMQMNADTFFDMIINKDLQINIDKTFYIDEIKEEGNGHEVTIPVK